MFFVSLIQGSLNYPFWGNRQTIQIYGNFDGFPLKPCVWVGNIMTPVISRCCLERSEKKRGYQKSLQTQGAMNGGKHAGFRSAHRRFRFCSLFLFEWVGGETSKHMYFQPDMWGNDPFWQDVSNGWVKNHQLDNQCTSGENVFPKDMLDSGWSYDVVCSLTQIDRTPLSLYIYIHPIRIHMSDIKYRTT